MGKTIDQPKVESKAHKNTKYNRLQKQEQEEEPDFTKKNQWPSDAVIYIGHLPHGFYEDQLKQYFNQYCNVLAVKVARSKKTARSKGYGFVQFQYPQAASRIAETMNGYLVGGKVLRCHTLEANAKNPFTHSSAKKYKFINWKRIYLKNKNKDKTKEQTAKEVSSLLKKEQEKKQKLKSLGIEYEYPGYGAHIIKESSVVKTKKIEKKKK